MGLNHLCQGANCTKSTGAVTPIQTAHGIRNLCDSCSHYELKFHRFQNQHNPSNPLPVPAWSHHARA